MYMIPLSFIPLCPHEGRLCKPAALFHSASLLGTHNNIADISSSVAALHPWRERLQIISKGCDHVVCACPWNRNLYDISNKLRRIRSAYRVKQNMIGTPKYTLSLIHTGHFSEASKMSSASNRSKKYKRRKMNEKRGLAFLPRFSDFCVLHFY